jgi:hypothetical protein
MKTVSDLIRHRATLEVICENCPNRGFVNHRFLMGRYGGQGLLMEIPFSCSRCNGTKVRLRPVPDNLGETRPLKAAHFGGVYAKFQD